MTSPLHSPPASPDDWVVICERELSNLSGAYYGKQSNDAKIDHALQATEAVLKAIIWKVKAWERYPNKTKGAKYLYNHNLEAMLDQTGLRDRLRANDDLWASWKVLVNAVVKQHRYSPTVPTDDEANAVALSTRSIDEEVVPWLLKRYQEMT